jgi:general secretion pathway protein I
MYRLIDYLTRCCRFTLNFCSFQCCVNATKARHFSKTNSRSYINRAGFTLIEVMVALAITAIALIAGLKATETLTKTANRQASVLLGHVCAENAMIGMRLARRLPGVGDSDEICVQGGRNFTVTKNVRLSPNPFFRHVQVVVTEGGWVVVRLSALIGTQ